MRAKATAAVAAQFEVAPGLARVRALRDSFAAATPDTVLAILEGAAMFAETWLTPINDVSDAAGSLFGAIRPAATHRG